MFTALVLGTKRSLSPKRNNNDNSIHSPKTGWHGWTPLGKMSTTLTVLRRIQPLFNIFLVTGQFGLDAIANVRFASRITVTAGASSVLR